MRNSAPHLRQRKRIHVALVLLACVPLWTACAAPERARKPLTLATLYGPDRVDFSGSHVSDLKWSPDGLHYLERRGDILQQIDVATGEATPAYDHVALEAALQADPDFDPMTAAYLARHPEELNEDRTVALLEHNDRLYFYRFAEGTLKRLTDEPAVRREITLSPDHAYIAFILDNNLYTIDTATAQAAQLTEDGSDTLLNGVLDWVYQEELYGRGNWRAYWWSDNSHHIAYLQLNEADVPVYPLVDYLPVHPTTESLRYPKAGDPNPKVRLGVVTPDGGDTVWIDLSQYDGTDILIPRVSWSPDGRLIYGVQDRESRWLDLNAADPAQGTPHTLLHESSPAWVECETPPKWLPDGSFLWLSARDGWQHIYLYTRDGDLLRRVTTGEWEVRDLLGMDPEVDCVYFSGTRDSPVETHVYRTQLAGGPVERLTTPGSSHRVSFGPLFHYFVDTFSNVTTPTRVDLRRCDGELVRQLSTNDVPALGEYRFSTPEFLRVPTPAGHALNALIIRPPTGRPHQKHPVLTFVYGGPHMPIVHNRWDGDDYIFQQWLAAQGYIVWVCDPYSAGGEGAVSAWHAYQHLGVTELVDLEASLHWLAEHENADLTRVGIVGHSYGGYLAAFALTHSKMFKLGIAGSALTDWRNYDSVYAERLMRTPEHNPDGYAAASAVDAAQRLCGRLLLVHGALDDNVHLPNLMQFIHAAEEADKSFDLMIYPTEGHGVYGPHWDRLQVEFILGNL